MIGDQFDVVACAEAAMAVFGFLDHLESVNKTCSTFPGC